MNFISTKGHVINVVQCHEWDEACCEAAIFLFR
jgi:hypothetical protein